MILFKNIIYPSFKNATKIYQNFMLETSLSSLFVVLFQYLFFLNKTRNDFRNIKTNQNCF